MQISPLFNQFSGTIAPGGTVSQTIDTEGWMVTGLIVAPLVVGGTLASGSLQFSVGFVPGTLYPLNDNTNTRVSISFGTAATAYTLAAVQGIAPYRYVRVTITSQGLGARIVLPVKN